MSLLFVVKEGFSGLGRAKLPATLTVIISFFALVLLGLFGSVSLSFFEVLQELRSRVEVEVFVADSLSEPQMMEASARIKELRGVQEVRVISKDEAATLFQRDFGEDIVRILGSNPLPRSLKVKLQPEYATPKQLNHMVPIFRSIVPESDIRYNQSFLGQVEENARLFTIITGGTGLLISFATIVLVGYTIRLAMYARKEKIRTMRLVGATAWFIGAPYVIEGALQGLLAGGLAAGALYLLFEQVLAVYEPSLYQIVQASSLYVYPAVAVLGLLLGILGSLLSVSKFLRAASKGAH
uniref:Cell division protein FtsX n=1 Tax=Chlorobium chlorochromatii (strain CaD3) TaxID=340177 RepID=Q3AT75_CHLCH